MHPRVTESGLIADLGLIVLRKVFGDSKNWPSLRVAVNLSAAELRVSSLVPRVRDLIRELDVDPSQFEIELSESVLIGENPIVERTLEQLSKLGFSIALDDFGTSYSSLNYLRRYPISKIKIDRSFVSNLNSLKDSGAFLESLVSLARSLSLSVVAEGIETTEQWQVLSSVGCNEGQGYLFSKPVSSQAIDAMFSPSAARKLA